MVEYNIGDKIMLKSFNEICDVHGGYDDDGDELFNFIDKWGELELTISQKEVNYGSNIEPLGKYKYKLKEDDLDLYWFSPEFLDNEPLGKGSLRW